MNSKSKTRAYLTPKEAAEFLKVSTETVRQWAKTGLLNAETTLGGHRRFSKEEVSRFAKALQKREKTKTDNLRVLIVDDDQQYVRFVEELVSGFADHIITEKAFDGFEAGHKIDIFRPDIVLLDLVMPSINGIEVCRYLKQNKKTRHIRIIATTGFTSDLNVQNFLNAGAEAVLDKPLEIESLKQLLLDVESTSVDVK